MKPVHLAHRDGPDPKTAADVAETFAAFISVLTEFRQAATVASELALAILEVEDLMASMLEELSAAKNKALDLNA